MQKQSPLLPLRDTFLQAYLECALWSSCDDAEHPLDDTFGLSDFAPAALAQAAADCSRFAAAHAADLLPANYHGSTADALVQAGHDFWLTRNGHGSGFGDGDWLPDVGERLSAAAHTFGDTTIQVGSDGLLYFWP